MTDTTDPCVDASIDALPGWQQLFCREVRQLVHAADGQVTETIMRSNRPASSCRLHSFPTGASSPTPTRTG